MGPNMYGIVYDSTITSSGSDIGIGHGGSYSGRYRSTNVTLSYPAGNRLGDNGYTYSKLRLNNASDAIDTYIGGDDDEDTYYFDYDSNNKIILYSTEETPIETLSGEGTSEDPYIIANLTDWRKVMI